RSIGHGLGFAKLLHGNPDGTQFHGTLGKAWQLVGLDVGTQFQPMAIGIILRAAEVGFDPVEIDQHGRRLEFAERCHLPLNTSSTKRRLPAVKPASTGNTVPVMPDAASEQKNTAALATSVGETMRPSG